MAINKNFILIEYNNVPYPDGYCSDIKEVAGHLDKALIEKAERYSLHTEYSYGKRNLDSSILDKFEALRTAHKDRVPQLWKSEEWAAEFAAFIIELTKDNNPPTIIEIHPPFNDYCDTAQFVQRYQVFEKKIHQVYPATQIVIENRAGAIYKGGRFVVSTAAEIAQLCSLIVQCNINLGVVLDFPQLLTAERIDTLKFDKAKYEAAIDKITQHREQIKGIHIWGKRKSQSGRWVAHTGTLNTYFGDNVDSKSAFIRGIMKVCNDGAPRFLVPEVNSSADDLASIVNDIFSFED